MVARILWFPTPTDARGDAALFCPYTSLSWSLVAPSPMSSSLATVTPGRLVDRDQLLVVGERRSD